MDVGGSTIRRGKKDISAYIETRISQLRDDMEKAYDPHDRGWYNRLIQELAWAKSPYHNCNGSKEED